MARYLEHAAVGRDHARRLDVAFDDVLRERAELQDLLRLDAAAARLLAVERIALEDDDAVTLRRHPVRELGARGTGAGDQHVDAVSHHRRPDWTTPTAGVIGAWQGMIDEAGRAEKSKPRARASTTFAG